MENVNATLIDGDSEEDMSTREAFHNWNDQQPESFYADKNKYDLMFEAWQACQAHNAKDIAELVEALDMLLITKEYKDKQGKDAVYETMRQAAWANAENVSAKHKGQS